MWGPYNMEIVDMVKVISSQFFIHNAADVALTPATRVCVHQIPDDLPAGPYVLGWRWDCEFVFAAQAAFASVLMLC